MITPIRGRKLEYLCGYSSKFVSYIRNDNPDKGTETYVKWIVHVKVTIRLEMITPIRGRKHIRPLKAPVRTCD